MTTKEKANSHIADKWEVTMKSSVGGVIGCLCLILLTLQAQPSSGTYTMYAGQAPVATESYTLSSAPDGTLRAEAEIIVRGVKQKLITAVSKQGPASFSLEAGGVKRLSAEFSGSTVKLQIAGQAERQVETKATLILENAVWHHYIFLI